MTNQLLESPEQLLGSREDILQASEDLFSEEGFYGASLRKISERVGMKNPSLLHHFPSKKKLYAAVLARIADELAAMATNIRALRDDRARLEAMIDEVFDWQLRSPTRARLVMRELLDNLRRSDEVERWFLGDAARAFGDMIALAQARGIVVPCDPMLAFFHLVGAVSYVFAGAATIAGILDEPAPQILERYRREARLHTLRSLLVDPQETL